MSNDRAKFGSRFGLILATAGSAVGLGNIWRFPYMTGNNGGAAFILVYIEELSKTIVQIITNRNSGAARKNPELIQSVYSTLLLDHDFLMKNNAADICSYLNHDDNYGLQRMEVAAKTLVEESYLNDDAAETLGKALELLEFIQANDQTFSFERISLMQEIRERMLMF